MAKESVDERGNVVILLSELPKKIIALHGLDNLAEFVLYELCHHDDVVIDRAAFLVDSPAFNYMKGIAGIDRHNKFANIHWENPEDFTAHMQQCAFNASVRSGEYNSIHNSPYDKNKAQTIAQSLKFDNPQFYSWPMKHENRGFLIYERSSTNNTHENHLFNGLHLLSFCPVF